MSSLTQRLPRKYKEQSSLQDAALNYAQFKAYDTTWPVHMSRMFDIQECKRKLHPEIDFSHQPSNCSRLWCLERELNLSSILMLGKSILFVAYANQICGLYHLWKSVSPLPFLVTNSTFCSTHSKCSPLYLTTFLKDELQIIFVVDSNFYSANFNGSFKL